MSNIEASISVSILIALAIGMAIILGKLDEILKIIKPKKEEK